MTAPIKGLWFPKREKKILWLPLIKIFFIAAIEMILGQSWLHVSQGIMAAIEKI